MAKVANKLKSKSVAGLPTGLHSDGQNLYLRVRDTGSRQWVLLYKKDGRQRELGLGGAGPGGLTVEMARAAAEDARQLLRKGVDPIEQRAIERENEKTSDTPTFGECADQYIRTHRDGWANAKHAAQWSMTMNVYAGPIRTKKVDEITTSDIAAILYPIWLTKHETATRVRERIEAILDVARVHGHIHIDKANPARWRGHLEHLMPRYAEPVQNYRAMAYTQLPDFMARLRKREAVSALALEWTILTASRTDQTLSAQWSEIQKFDDELIWSIPAWRMKTHRSHVVPLVGRTIEIVQILGQLRLTPEDGQELLFPGIKRGRPLSDMAMTMQLRRMGEAENTTVHGFRSAFRDWAGNETNHQREFIEEALAHAVGNEVERAYRRGHAIKKRRQILNDWDAYCSASGTN